MAKLSADGKYVTVEKGDTLYSIAKNYGKGLSYKQIAQLNGIADPSKIYVGQKINLTGAATSGSSGSSSSGSSTANSNMASVTQFGLQSGTENTLFAVWTWSKDNTDKYEIEWTYDTGDRVWFVGSKSSTEDKQCTYSIPSNATRVKFRVKPVSKTYTSNNKETSYWTASWSTDKIYDLKEESLPIPPKPDVEIKNYTLTATIQNIGAIHDTAAYGIEINIERINGKTGESYKSGYAVFRGDGEYMIYSTTVDAGGEYIVRARTYSYLAKRYSEWSDFSSPAWSVPSIPGGFTQCKSKSRTSVYLEWPEVSFVDTYDIEYATKKEYFDGSSEVRSQTGIESTHFEITGLETGSEYFFRLRAVNEGGESGWSEISSVVLGKKPTSPTTWSSTTTAMIGDAITLYWVHNSADGSSQTSAELEVYIGDEKQTHYVQNTTDEDEKDKTSSFVIDTSSWTYGYKIQWRVRTAGVFVDDDGNKYGEWSVQRTIDVYDPPILALTITDRDNRLIDTLEAYPFNIHALAGPEPQKPVSYHLSITANESYETTDSVGNTKLVSKGNQVYSKSFDISDDLVVEMTAGDVDLQNNVSYKVACVVSMNSGLTAESFVNFTVLLGDQACHPNAEINMDRDAVVTHIRPYCEQYRINWYVVGRVGDEYTKTDTPVEIETGYAVVVKNGIILENGEEDEDFVYTTTGEQVLSGITKDGDNVAYCTVLEKFMPEGFMLSVYRREFDGTFTEIARDIDNATNTFVTDPHPSLDYARYRIVATSKTAGTISYYDLPPYPIGEKAVIIQWDEKWTQFETSEETALSEPAWAGSLLRLPYNIDVSNNYAPDVSLVEYVGRKHPVSYYGTQLGESASWGVEIPKSDKTTLYALRRLAVWMDDVYVREPSGSGYWANITVSFSQTHCAVTIPVTLDITRVEGGI